MFRRTTSLLLAALFCLALLPTATFAAQKIWVVPGNSDLNILNGGVMLNGGGDFYFVENGIFVQSGGEIKALSADDGRNLNLYDGYIYYTAGSEIRRVPKGGGPKETVYRAGSEIREMYVVGGDKLYLSCGSVYELKEDAQCSVEISSVPDISGFIPTEYGNIYLTGEPFDRTLWVKGRAVLSGIGSCYTDSGYLALSMGGKNSMVPLAKLFDGFDAKRDLQEFNIHGRVLLSALLSPDEENAVSGYNDNDALEFDPATLLRKSGLSTDLDAEVSLMAENPTAVASATPETVVPPLSDGQKNIVKRARQMTEIQWTPLEDVSKWGQNGVFKAETTYKGLPYGQPINCNGYIGYGVSLDTFSSAVLDNTSIFYTSYSTYNKIAPCYSTDCSAFVSYAWGLTERKTTYSLTDVAEKVGDQSLYSLQVGDCLDRTSGHVVLVTGISYDASGSISGLEISEESPAITDVVKYGAGQSKSLASFQAYYMKGGFVIYRNPGRDSVSYTPSAAVPLDGEMVSGMKDAAPKSHTEAFVGGKSVTLTSDEAGAAIYYTLDGSLPTVSSKKYSGAISVTGTTKLSAIAVSGSYAGSSVLEYTVKVPQAASPSASLISGLSSGNLVSSGAQVTLSSASGGAVIYYTTDGSEPTSASSVYSAPISLTQNTTIKAFAAAPGMKASPISSASYKIGSVYTISASAKTGGGISPSGRAQVLASCSKTYGITASDGYVISDVQIDGASVGAVSSYTFQNVSSDHSISADFKSTAQLPFRDIDKGAWYYGAVQFAYTKSLFNGTAATAFSPDNTMTRGMFVTVLGRFAGLSGDLESGIGVVAGTDVNIRSGPSTDSAVAGVVRDKYTAVQVLSQNGGWYGVKYGTVTGFIRGDLIRAYSGNFTDLLDGKYYSPYAQWAFLTGITGGTAFLAETNISREDMCLMLYNFGVLYGKSLPQTVSRAAFSDDSAISPSARTAVYALQQAGIINGMGGGCFCPTGTATRAQVAQIYMKFVSAVG